MYLKFMSVSMLLFKWFLTGRSCLMQSFFGYIINLKVKFLDWISIDLISVLILPVITRRIYRFVFAVIYRWQWIVISSRLLLRRFGMHSSFVHHPAIFTDVSLIYDIFHWVAMRTIRLGVILRRVHFILF